MKLSHQPTLLQRIGSILFSVFMNPYLQWPLGLIWCIMGIIFVFDIPRFQTEANYATQTQPLTVAALENARVGTPTLLEGQISEQTPIIYRSLVTYIREEYLRRQWREIERTTQPLQIVLTDGEITIRNDDYAFDTTATTAIDANAQGGRGVIQVRGYRVGDPVLAIGTVVETPAGKGVRADTLFAGTRASYIAHRQTLIERTAWVSAGFMIWGVASIVLGAWGLHVVLRDERRLAAQRPTTDNQPVPLRNKRRKTRQQSKRLAGRQ